MNVKNAPCRNVEDRLWKDLPVGHGDHGLRRQRAQLFNDLRPPHAPRLVDGQAQPQSRLFYWRALKLLAAAFGPVGLREHRCDFVTRGDRSLQGRNGEIRSAKENQSHTDSAPLVGLLQLADLAPDQVALQRADVAYVKLAVQMIRLMQKRSCQ